jgi:thiamine-phosphate pyrophosphorylase
MQEVYRILDANFNRAREALRVVEDCGRFAFNDPAITAMAKHMRSDLREVLDALPTDQMLATRDTPGDIGTEITSPTEPTRRDLPDVARAACKRLSESLRTIEEYSKVVSPAQTPFVEKMRYNVYTLEQRLFSRLWVGQRFGEVKLYMLVTSSACPGSVRNCVRGAIAGGVDAVQVREKNVPDAQFLALAAELRELTDEMGKLLIINDRPDIAAMVGADGVHLGQGDLPIAESRRLLRPGAIVGRSTHSLAQAKAAVMEGADYIGVGPVFPTETKSAGPEVGTDLIKQVAESFDIPIAAIGGITPDLAKPVIEAGASCLAVSGALCCAETPKAVAQQFASLFNEKTA